jgi:hypothetical protein
MKFKDLIPGNSLYILCIDPETDEATGIREGIVDSLNDSGTVLGVRLLDPSDKSKTILRIYFRVNPEHEINDSLLEDKEHRLKSVFESKTDAISKYIEYCESKIEQYRRNIESIGRKFIIP